MKTLFAVVLCAAFSGVIVIVFLRVLGVDSRGVIGAGVGGGVGAVVAMQLNSKSKRDS